MAAEGGAWEGAGTSWEEGAGGEGSGGEGLGAVAKEREVVVTGRGVVGKGSGEERGGWGWRGRAAGSSSRRRGAGRWWRRRTQRRLVASGGAAQKADGTQAPCETRRPAFKLTVSPRHAMPPMRAGCCTPTHQAPGFIPFPRACMSPGHILSQRCMSPGLYIILKSQTDGPASTHRAGAGGGAGRLRSLCLCKACCSHPLLPRPMPTPGSQRAHWPSLQPAG